MLVAEKALAAYLDMVASRNGCNHLVLSRIGPFWFRCYHNNLALSPICIFMFAVLGLAI